MTATRQSVSVAVSTSASTSHAAPGFLLLAWGLVASLVGLGLVGNFRGAADAFARNSHDSTAWMRRLPWWRQTAFEDDEDGPHRVTRLRLIAIPFAILGPIATVAGVAQIARGHIGVPRGPALPLPVALAFVGAGLLVVAQYWRRGGLFRIAMRQGGWKRTAAILASLGAVCFGVFCALGLTTLAIAGWLVGALCVGPLAISRTSVPPGADAGIGGKSGPGGDGASGPHDDVTRTG